MLKKKSYIFSKESLSDISGNGTLYFSAQAWKIKKIHPEKISYISGNGNPERNSFIFSYIFSKESFLYIPGKGGFLSSKKEKFLMFWEIELSYISEESQSEN